MLGRRPSSRCRCNELADETTDNVIVIPQPLSAAGDVVLSWFSRAGDAVGFDDFFLFADNFGLAAGQEGYDATYDIVPNGNVDFDDFFRFADDFGTTIANAAEIQALLESSFRDDPAPGGTSAISWVSTSSSRR